MQLILCLDDRNGISFGGRRQSRDRAVCKKCIELTANSKLWMSVYSGGIFTEYADRILVADNFLDKADKSDFCFVENCNFVTKLDYVDRIVLFRWNRHYPADTYFPVDLNDGTWNKCNMENFTGNSHERITMEEYIRCND